MRFLMCRKVLYCFLLFLGACSSVKVPVQPQEKIDADKQLSYALQMESSKDFSTAIESYTILMEKYRSFADIQGLLTCLSGLARIELASGKEAGFLNYKARMQERIQNIAPELEYYLLLLDIYYYQQKSNYVAISRIATIKESYPKEIALELATAKLQADSYLAIAEEKQVKELINLSKKIEKQQKKAKYNNPELLSSAWYALAYYYFRNADYQSARGYINKAQDWDYRFGNFSSMAHCLWLKAQISAAENKMAEAKSNWLKAEGIFLSLRDTAAVEEMNRSMQKILQEQKK